MSFSTFNTARTGLTAAQRALDTTGQNIVNANTPGYSRQRVLLESSGPTTSASLHSGNKANFGGVNVTDVTRIRDAFLEATRAAAGGRQSSISASVDVLSGAELLLSEPGEVGLQSAMDDFYSAWHDLSLNPTDTAAGSVVLQRGQTVAERLRTVSDGLAAQWVTAHSKLDDVVAQTNQASADLAKLNVAIRAGQTAGEPVNELLDTRDTLVRKLASLVGAYASTSEEGVMSVSVNGVAIVSGSEWQALSLTSTTDISSATADPPELRVGVYTVPVESGSAAGLLAVMRTDLPSMSAKVDAVAVALRDSVNGIYDDGYDPNGDTGLAFFSGTTAQTLAVVPTDGGALAVAASSGVVDGTIARKIGDLADDTTAAAALGGPGASVRWRELTSVFGVQLQSLRTASTVQESVVATAEDAVQSSAGVNLDEEMTNLMLFQRAYQASARVITTADEVLDTLINRTGRVGL